MSSMYQRLTKAFLRVPEVDVFTNNSYGNLALGVFYPLHDISPPAQVSLAYAKVQFFYYYTVEPVIMEHNGDFINIFYIPRNNYCLSLHITEKGNLSFYIIGYRSVGSAYKDVRLYAYLYNHNIHFICGLKYASLDLVSYMRDHLNGTAEVFAAPFFRNNVIVYFTCRVIVFS